MLHGMALCQAVALGDHETDATVPRGHSPGGHSVPILQLLVPVLILNLLLDLLQLVISRQQHLPHHILFEGPSNLELTDENPLKFDQKQRAL